MKDGVRVEKKGSQVGASYAFVIECGKMIVFFPEGSETPFDMCVGLSPGPLAVQPPKPIYLHLPRYLSRQDKYEACWAIRTTFAVI